MASKGFKVLKPTVRFEIACPIGSRKMPSFECLECRPSANSNFGLKIQKKFLAGAKIFAKSLRNLLPKWVTKNDPGLISSVYLQYQTTPKGIQKEAPKWFHIFLSIFNFSTEKMRKKNCAQKLNFRGARIPSIQTKAFSETQLGMQIQNALSV